MPKVPKLGHLPKHHAIHGTAEEKSERALRQAEDENREFYEENARYAREVSLIQTGINERVARLLTRNFVDNSMNGGPVSPEMVTVREERIQSELYRAVQGNELYETEKGEDSKNYLGSVNVDHMTSGRPKRAIEEMKNVARGALKMVGGNNYIEAKLEDRFGKNGDLFIIRNQTLSRSIEGYLSSVEANDPAAWLNIKTRLNVNSADAAVKKIAAMSLGDLQTFDQWLATAQLPGLHQNVAYRRMLSPIEHDLALGRRLYVAMRFRSTLEKLAQEANTQMFVTLLNQLGLTPDPNGDFQGQVLDVIEALAGLRLSELRGIRSNPNLAPIWNDAAFQDLMLLVDVEQRESSKLGLDEVYDHQTLRKFWHDLHKAGGHEAQLASLVEDMLEQNSLFPLENNPEGKALLAEIRARVESPVGSAEKLIAELRAIRADEIPTPDLDESENKKLEESRKELNDLAKDARTVLYSMDGARDKAREADRKYNDAKANLEKYAEKLLEQLKILKTQLESDISHIQNQLTNASHLTPQQRTQLSTLLKNNREDLKKYTLDITDLEIRKIDSRVIDDQRNDLNSAREARKEAMKELNDLQSKAKETAQKITNADVQYRIAQHWPKLDPIRNFLATTPFAKFNDQIDIAAILPQSESIFQELNDELIEKKTTPFIMLQRLMRRDYYAGRGLDTAVFNKKFNEEANHYALVKAGLRVQDVKNVDLIRSSNDKAAKYMKRGLHLRGWDRLTHAVAKGQNFFGLEPFEIQNLSEDMLLQQIIDSEPEFAVFQGVNKFTTTRDLRDILHKTGQEVSTETFERFAQVLEEAVTKFKKVPPSLYKGVRMGDWDLENLIIVLQKMKVESWSRKFLDKVEKTGGDGEREKILIGMLKQSRAEEQKISASIAADVKHPDAMWRKYLVKNELKQLLDQEEVEGMNKVKAAGVEFKKKQMQKLESEMNTLPEGSPDKVRMAKEIANLKQEVTLVEKQIADSKDLYEKVEAARVYIRENDLSRKEKKAYLKEMGLTQVFDKMSTNFRLQRAWHYTKRAGAAMWSGTKKAWAWSRRNIINMDKAKKAFSIGRIAATPITWPLSKAWKIGTFPFRLTGRAMVRATHMPKRFLGIFSKSMMRSYLRDRVVSLEEQIDAISLKQSKLQAKLAKVPYSWDKRRLRKQINSLEEDKIKLGENLADYKKMAADKKVDIGEVSIYRESANDNDYKKAA